jgi:hypothetical protein
MKTVPALPTDTSAEAFLDRDLSSRDFTHDPRPKSARLPMRLTPRFA